ncbi:MAG: YggS family pyridoxal phosphate-dependent enzyme [Phormidesmis sp.]
MSSAKPAAMPDSAARLSEKLAAIRDRLPSTVRLIAVTKTFPASIIRLAYAEGIRDFAENKVQEALEKQETLGDLTDVTWHFIGHIQSNKSRKVLENFDWIHSIDSLKLANRLDRQAAELNRRPNCYLQVKLMPDPNKDGFERDQLMASLAQLDQLSHIQIRGLMVILPYGLSEQQAKSGFDQARQLATEIANTGILNMQMDQLSMGMSGDFESAIAAGATMIRIGSGLFGQR